MGADRTGGFSIVGIGAAACAACCAGPILAFLGGLGVAGLATTVILGVAGLVVAAIAIVAITMSRRRRLCVIDDDGPVPVAAPTRRTSGFEPRASETLERVGTALADPTRAGGSCGS